MTDHQYDIGLVVYCCTYIARLVFYTPSSFLVNFHKRTTDWPNSNSEVPSNLIMKRVSPKIWLPFLTVAWGIITMCLGFMQNYGTFMVLRALLGAAEGGLLPGIVRTLRPKASNWWSNNFARSFTCPTCTLAARWLSVSDSSSPALHSQDPLEVRMSLCFSWSEIPLLTTTKLGFLARGLNEMGTRGGLSGWRWIFIFEGLIVCLTEISSLTFIFPQHWQFLP